MLTRDTQKHRERERKTGRKYQKWEIRKEDRPELCGSRETRKTTGSRQTGRRQEVVPTDQKAPRLHEGHDWGRWVLNEPPVLAPNTWR